MANRNYSNGGKLYAMEVRPVIVNCSFTVDSSNANGLGISSAKLGPLVQNVFMHTSATPGAGNSNNASPNIAVSNPNPASGLIIVQLQDGYKQLLGMSASVAAPQSGSDVKIDNSAMTAGQMYVITTLGNATLAKWQAIGVPKGITPAVGVVFIAASNGGSGNTLTSRVQAMASAGPGVDQIILAADPSLMLSPSPSAAQGFGAQIILAAMKQSITMGAYTPAGTNSAPALTMNSYTPAGTNDSSTPPIFTGTPEVLTGSVAAPTFTGTAASLSGTAAPTIAAPADGSVIQLRLMFNDSSVVVSGE